MKKIFLISILALSCLVSFAQKKFTVSETKASSFRTAQSDYKSVSAKVVPIDTLAVALANLNQGLVVGAKMRSDTNVAFEVNAPKTLLFPRLTTTQRDALTNPTNGSVIYNSTTNKLQVRASGAWVDLH